MEQGRRKFLGQAGSIALLLGLGGLESILGSGCAGTRQVSRANIDAHQTRIRSNIADPHGYTQYLKKGEYIIPSDVFEAFAKTVDKTPTRNQVGGYISNNHLNTTEKQEEFSNRMRKFGLEQEDIDIYNKLLTTTDTIIFKASVLEDRFFEKALPHERFHKELNHLPGEQYRHLARVANKILSIKTETVQGEMVDWVRENHILGCSNCRVMYAHKNWEEFYTYLAQGEFVPEVEQKLKKDNPYAYSIFNRIREKTRLRKEGK